MSRSPLPSRLTLLCCLLLPLALPEAAAQGKQHHALKHPRQQIEALEEQWRTASLNGDAAVMEKLLSEDYVGISWTGQINTKAMQLDRVRTKTVVIRKMDLSDVKIKISDSIAVVTSMADVESTSDGNETTGDFRYTRVYSRNSAGVWKITNFEATRILNGEHRRHGPPPPPPPPGPTQ